MSTKKPTAPQLRTSIPYVPPPSPSPHHMGRHEAMLGHARIEAEQAQLSNVPEAEAKLAAAEAAARKVRGR